MDNIIEDISNIYKKSGYFDKYGGSVFMTTLILFIFFMIHVYFWVRSMAQPIRDNWAIHKCSPHIMPFAGLIMDHPEETAFDYAGNNFSQCLRTIGFSIGSISMDPFKSLIAAMDDMFQEAITAMNNVTSTMTNSRSSFLDIFDTIFSQISTVSVETQRIFINLKDALNKIQGVLTTTLYTGLGVFDTISTALSGIWELVVIALVGMTIIIVALAAGFFTIPAALVALAIYVPIAVLMGYFLVILKHAFKLQGLKRLPKKPKVCFAAGTKIDTINGKINVEDLVVGTKLTDESVVTSTMVLSSYEQTMYNLNGIIVSDTHKLLYNNKFIWVYEHPEAVKLDKFLDRHIYCFNTSNKVITINNIVFTDWDDLDHCDILKMVGMAQAHISVNQGLDLEDGFRFELSDIHQYLESGFRGDTAIELETGGSVPIKDLQIGTILKGGERIIGTVCIDASDIDTFEYTINNQIINGAANLQFYQPDLGNFYETSNNCIHRIITDERNKYDKLYHILTDTNNFKIGNIIFYDYNGAIDYYLNALERPVPESFNI